MKTKTSNLFDYVIRNISYDIDTEEEEEFAELFIKAEEAQARQEAERQGVGSDEFDDAAAAAASNAGQAEQRSINTEEAQVRLTFKPKGGKEVKIYVTKSDVYTRIEGEETNEPADGAGKAEEVEDEGDSERTEAALKKIDAPDDKGGENK